jgi:hypothetical protein
MIRHAHRQQAVSRHYKAPIAPRAASGAKRPFMRKQHLVTDKA